MIWKNRIIKALNERAKQDILRKRTVVESGSSRFLIYQNRRYLNFSSNDYLGLSQHPSVINAWQKGADQFGIGSGGSGHINGYTVAHKQLEETLAEWLNYSNALLFISGFTANQAVITALTRKNDLIIADRLSHASLLEAAVFSKAKLRRFMHNDVTDLNKLIVDFCSGELLVITEGIFSMDGDSAPLNSIYPIVNKKNAWLMVDDAHGIGITGNDGCGSCNIQNVKPELLVVAFSKGIGVSGAAVLCDEDTAQYMLQFSRHLIYSTSMPPAQVSAILAAINIVRSDDGEYRRQRLLHYINTFRSGVNKSNFKLNNSNSAIQTLIVGNNKKSLYLANNLRNVGIWATAILPPTVPIGTARIRFTLTAAHKLQDIYNLLEAIDNVNQ